MPVNLCNRLFKSSLSTSQRTQSVSMIKMWRSERLPTFRRILLPSCSRTTCPPRWRPYVPSKRRERLATRNSVVSLTTRVLSNIALRLSQLAYSCVSIKAAEVPSCRLCGLAQSLHSGLSRSPCAVLLLKRGASNTQLAVLRSSSKFQLLSGHVSLS